MRFSVSLRVRLVFWYSAIVALSLAAFGVYTYLSVSSELHDNLDASLLKVASSLDYIINKNQNESQKTKKQRKENQDDKFSIFRDNEKRKFIGPLRPEPPSQKDEKEDKSAVWSAVYEHILLNTKNYFIQIADTNNVIVWRSKNLQNDSLPILPDYSAMEDSVQWKLQGNDTMIKFTVLDYSLYTHDTFFKDLKINGQEVRLLIKRNNSSIVSIGYTIEEIQTLLRQLFSILLIAAPILLIASVIGGLILSKLSLRAIDEITRAADDISAKNLSMRLPEVPTNDEVGHLIKTLNKMIERLEASFIQIKQFTSDASHELRTPLTILQGELELALHGDKSIEDYEVVVASALEEVARLTNVVQTLLELSRAETGQIQMNLEKHNLSKILQDIAEDAEILAEFKGIGVKCSIQDNINCDIDPPRIHQAVLNIVDNAIKYTPEGGKISISLENTDGTTHIIVSDTGIGIPDDHLPHIFDRFYRVDKSRSSHVQGVGLGLSIVKWIVDAHNGEIVVNSLPNYGTTFTIKLENKAFEMN